MQFAAKGVIQWRLFAFVYGFTFKMHPIVYLLIWNNMDGYERRRGIYAAILAGNRTADRRHGVLHILCSKLEHSVSRFFQYFNQIYALDRPMRPAEFGK